MSLQRRRVLSLLALAAASLAIPAVGAPASADGTPRFEPTSCDLPDSAGIAARLRCGVVRVPRDHAHPDGPIYALAVVVITSAIQPAQPDPVVYINGGPGAPLTVYTGYQAGHPYAPDRNLVLVDQRGTGRSEPRLCPELQSDLVNGMLAVAIDPTADALAVDRAAHMACRNAIRARGVDLDTFGTAATVEDYEWVRRALGIARWNVVGTSYGTTVAMTLLARHPETVRSAVLDSLNPPDGFFGMPWSARMAAARDAFLAACGTNPTCSTANPDLPASYRKAIARLGNDASTIPLPTALRVPGDRIRLTPSLFAEVVGRLIYYRPYYAELPHLIAATSDGDFGPVGTALTTLLEGAKRADHEGAFIAVECRDRPRWREPATPAASPLDLALLPPGVCTDWSARGPEPEVPLATTVPALILQGEFDPNIRPDESRHVADAMGQSVRWVEFSGIGHSVRHHSACAQELVAAFIVRPDRQLEVTCATRQPGPEPRIPAQP